MTWFLKCMIVGLKVVKRNIYLIIILYLFDNNCNIEIFNYKFYAKLHRFVK